MADQENQKPVEQTAEQPAQQAQQPNVWVCDPVGVAHCDVSDKGVIYTVAWTDFMGLQHTAKVISLQHHDRSSPRHHPTAFDRFPSEPR